MTLRSGVSAKVTYTLRSAPPRATSTPSGRAALERSLRDYGPGRAVFIDRHRTLLVDST